MKICLLITTYNRPAALNLVLQTVANQTRVPDEIVVCDDGSSSATASVVRQWVSRLPLHHAWQPDRDFRAARSRNLGVSKTASEYLIWIDGDCMLPPQFVENHLSLAEQGYIVAGGRYLLADSETDSLLSDVKLVNNAFRHIKFSVLWLGPLRDLRPKLWKTVRTCNLGVFRSDIEAIGGFDESYVGWGREDSDLVVRLIHGGRKVRSARFSACVAHLAHAERSRHHLSKNDLRFCACLDDLTHVFAKSSILCRK